MNIFKRIFKIFQSEANSVVDELEDPIKLTEQGIRDLKNDLDKSLQAMAEVKALAIRTKRDAETYQNQVNEYEQKAMALLRKAERGEIAPEEADRLAEASLTKRAEAEEQLKRAVADYAKYDASVQKLDVSVKKLRTMVSKYENELKTLKARATVSSATKRVNKQLANIDSTGTVAMLQRMKEKVDKDESESEAYAEIAQESRSVDDEIEKALGGSTYSSSDALSRMKAKMNEQKSIQASPGSFSKSENYSAPQSTALESLKSKLGSSEIELRSKKADEA